MTFKRLFQLFLGAMILAGQAGYAMEDDGRHTPPPQPCVEPLVYVTPISKAALSLRRSIAERVAQACERMYGLLAHREKTDENFFIALDIDGVMLMTPSTMALFRRASLPAIRALVMEDFNAVPEVLAFYDEAIENDVDVYIVTARPSNMIIDQKTGESVDLEADSIEQLAIAGYPRVNSGMFNGLSWGDYQAAVALEDDNERDQFIGRCKQSIIEDILGNPKYKNYIFLDDTRANRPTHRIPTVEYPPTPLKALPLKKRILRKHTRTSSARESGLKKSHTVDDDKG